MAVDSQDLRRNQSLLDWLVRSWPILVALVAVATSWASFQSNLERLDSRVNAAEAKLERMEVQRESARVELKNDLDGIRNAIGKQQLILARICVLVSRGKDCD